MSEDEYTEHRLLLREDTNVALGVAHGHATDAGYR